jgi:hypothetical protein
MLVVGPTITFLGLAGADGQVLQPLDSPAQDGTPIYEHLVPEGFFVVVEAKPGPSNRAVATSTFNWDPTDPNSLPDLQIVVSRPLGNGSTRVCDDQNNLPIGGVPAVDPPMFGGTQASANAINDFACRFDARGTSGDACTRDPTTQEPRFWQTDTKVQFCPQVGIGAELAFPSGDTRITVRVRDILGQAGAPSSIFVRVP